MRCLLLQVIFTWCCSVYVLIMEGVRTAWRARPQRVPYKSVAPAHAARRLIAAQLYINQNVNGYSMLSAPGLVIMMLALGILIGWIGAISLLRATAHAIRAL